MILMICSLKYLHKQIALISSKMGHPLWLLHLIVCGNLTSQQSQQAGQGIPQGASVSQHLAP